MKSALDLDLLTKTFDDLSIGVGIFEVPDLNDIRSIRYVFMNKVILYEMRKEKEEVFGKRILDVAPEAFEHEGGLAVIETYRKVAAEGGHVNLGLVEYSNHMVAGTYECSVQHIKDNYVYVLLRNVTELEQAKNELEEKNREIEQFAYIVSHDLKAPIKNISNLAGLLKEEKQLSSGAAEILDYIIEAGERMTTLITDLLDYSRLGEDKEKVWVNCKEQVDWVLRDLASIIDETDAQIEVGALPELKGYETELRLLFQNLITNAIKFRREGVSPKIKIWAEGQNGWTFFVRDNGIGIEEKHQGKIFRVFRRLHSDEAYEGSGIGLAHCKKIVELHGGTMGVDSVFGEGTTFTFNIPKVT